MDRPITASGPRFLATAEVRAAIERALRGIPREDREDAVQEVLARALTVAEPPTLEECVALVVRIAKNLSVDELRKKVTRGKVDAGAIEDPDDVEGPDRGPSSHREPLDDKKQLAFVKAQIDAGEIPERTAKMLEGVADGVRQDEVAKELGLAHSTVRNEVGKARAKLRAGWAAYVAAAGVVVALIVVWLVLRGKRDEVTLPTPEQRAEEMRAVALRECDEERWQACLDGLDRARDLDQHGDQHPRVVAARRHAEEALLRPKQKKEEVVPQNLPVLTPDSGR
jgi:RNA polymerase sigma factor (sigma-70 family)